MTTDSQLMRRRAGATRIAVERRQELVSAAINSIADIGYGEVTVQSICTAAGFSRGLIGHYFRGKDELLLEAVRRVADELGAATRQAAHEAGDDAVDKLHALIRASFTAPGFTPEKVSVWVALASTARWSPELGELYRELWRAYRSQISRLITRANAERGTRWPPDRTALTFSQLIEGFWVGWAGDPEQVSASAAESACRDYLVNLFGPQVRPKSRRERSKHVT